MLVIFNILKVLVKLLKIIKLYFFVYSRASIKIRLFGINSIN